MIGNGKKIAALQKKTEELYSNKINTLQSQVEELSSQVLSSSEYRSHRKIDFDKPIKLTLRPLSSYLDIAIRQGLNDLFNESNHFSICKFEKLVELARIFPPEELTRHLNTLHCVHWNKMDPDYRQQIQHQIIAAFMPVESNIEEKES